MKKLVVCDFDGTLYRENDMRHLSRSLECIRRFSPGVAFAVASGRPLHLLKPYFDDLPGCFIFSSDGALITLNDRIVYQKPVEISKIREVTHEYEWVAYGECISYMHLKDRSQAYGRMKLYNSHAVRADDIDEIDENIYKIFFVGNIPEIDGLVKCYEKYGISEFVSNTVDKGKAVSYLAELLHIGKKDICAFGDSENDIPMFGAAGVSYAYEGASPEVRSHADGVFSDLRERLYEYEKL